MEVTIKESTIKTYNIILDEDKVGELMFILGSIDDSDQKLPVDITNELFVQLLSLLGRNKDNPKYKELLNKYPSFFLEASSY